MNNSKIKITTGRKLQRKGKETDGQLSDLY